VSTSHTFSLPEGYRRRPRVAPLWVGYLLLSPTRRWFQDPERILRPHVTPGDLVLEAGPGMGFFTLPVARLVGPTGRVVAIDCQAGMIDRLRRRAEQQGLGGRIAARACSEDSLQIGDLQERVDLALAINVVHEARDPERMVGELARCLRPGGSLFLSEPRGHVARELFLWEYGLCREAGLVASAWPRVTRQRTVLMEKPHDC